MRKFSVRSRGAVSLAAVGLLALGGSPASAAVSDGYVRGYDTYVGDWGDEGVLKLGGSNSNAVCLWQTVLWAEGAQEIDGTSFDQADIDGIFGRNTELATSSMQGRWDLEYVDGIVGSTTFGRADDQLEYSSGSEDRGRTLFLTYDGRAYDFTVARNSEGKYRFKDRSGVWQYAGYNTWTCN